MLIYVSLDINPQCKVSLKNLHLKPQFAGSFAMNQTPARRNLWVAMNHRAAPLHNLHTLQLTFCLEILPLTYVCVFGAHFLSEWWGR